MQRTSSHARIERLPGRNATRPLVQYGLARSVKLVSALIGHSHESTTCLSAERNTKRLPTERVLSEDNRKDDEYDDCKTCA